jgi:hypothetical protein
MDNKTVVTEKDAIVDYTMRLFELRVEAKRKLMLLDVLVRPENAAMLRADTELNVALHKLHAAHMGALALAQVGEYDKARALHHEARSIYLEVAQLIERLTDMTGDAVLAAVTGREG